MIPPQRLIVTCESPDVIAAFWEQMTEWSPGLFNAWFAVVPGRGTDD